MFSASRFLFYEANAIVGYGTELSMIALKEFVTAKTVVGN